MPLYATTSELRNGVWDKRPLRAPAIPESVPESMSPLEEELESPPPTPRMDSPPRPSTPQAPTEKDDLQARPSCFSLFRYFISILLVCLMTLLLVHINRPASHSASIIQNSPDIPSSQCLSPSELSSRIEFAAATYETQSLSRHPVKTNSVSLVSLQTKFDTVMDSLDSYPVANNLVHTEVEMRDLYVALKM
ncbi:hypothetical protein OPQ81_007914 [Rhizoctonia solani]|nr:hypothetical protein OPQ81_007914 [Rhizoctonia solani]